MKKLLLTCVLLFTGCCQELQREYVWVTLGDKDKTPQECDVMYFPKDSNKVVQRCVYSDSRRAYEFLVTDSEMGTIVASLPGYGTETMSVFSRSYHPRVRTIMLCPLKDSK